MSEKSRGNNINPSEDTIEYRSVFENMPSGVAYHRILTNKRNRPVDYLFVEINKAFEKIIGHKRERIVEKRVTEVLPEIKSSMFNWIDFYGEVASIGKEVKFEQYLKETGRWYAVSAYSPKKGYFITIYDDITERKKTEQSLRNAYDELKRTQAQLIHTEKMEVIGRLASGVAHEVKNPLAIIQQGIDYISKKYRGRGRDMHFAIYAVNDAIKRAAEILNHLLNFSRMSSLQTVPEDLNAIIRNSVLLVKNDIMRSRVRVTTDLNERIPKVNLDRNRIQQVFINLFMNAIEAMPRGGQLKIRTYGKRGQKHQGIVLVELEDTGAGIPDHLLEKVFEPFFTTKDIGKGTGLGLYIVRNIIEGHHGRIKIENRKDRRGARVRIEFKAHARERR
jgi:PAS domain S-box-containing protein